MNARISTLLPTLKDFDSARWRDWLILILTTGYASPAFSINYDRASQELMELADALADERRLSPFAEGVVLACQNMPPRDSTAYPLLTLIELIAGLTPPTGKRVLWNLLRGHELKHLRAANAKLEVIAVSALLCYGVDSDLLEYATLTARSSRDLNEIANCFRAARQSENHRQAYASFMPLLLRACQNQRDFRRVADEIVALTINYEFKDFRHWFLVHQAELPGIPGDFIDALKMEALPYLSAKMPGHARELNLATQAISLGLTPEFAVNEFRELLRIEPINVSDTLDFAIDLWVCLRRRFPRHDWSLHQTSALRAVQDTSVLYCTSDLEDRHMILTTSDGLLLNILNVALVKDGPLRQELRAEVLMLNDPATLDVITL